MRQLDIEKQASWPDYRDMNMNWLSRLPRLFDPVESMPAEYVDRDAERVARELELIKLRFPHHS
jgi:hypothetical protein